jgi:aminopeptidase
LDPRVVEHAKWLVNYCTSVKRGDNVLIRLGGVTSSGDEDGLELAAEVYKEASRLGAHSLLVAFPGEAVRGYYELTPEEDLVTTPPNYLELMKASDVMIGIMATANTHLLEQIDPRRIGKRLKAMHPIMQEQLKKRWTGTLHPTNAHAQEAGMSLAEYRDFVYAAILRDWNAEAEQMRKLKDVMEKSTEVQLIGKDTDLTFSIKGRIAVVDDAKYNFPGGEVFTAPIDDSASGKIYFDLPSVAYGKEVTDIRLTLEKGRICDYSATKNSALLRQMVETDEGSRRLGEFGVGTNRSINRFTKNILFDEKMAQTIHLAIGNAYEMCGGINKSAVHWDMIKTMKPGEILMDGKSVQKNGKFFWE